MSTSINKKVWLYVERLYIHVYSPRKFIEFLGEHDIKYSESYDGLFNFEQSGKDSVITPDGYEFMSEENDSFMNIMERTPNYNYMKILNEIIFDETIKLTKEDTWNYFGERVSEWYSKIIEFLCLADMSIDYETNQIFQNESVDFDETGDFLKYPFNDEFLDYIRKEINESYNNRLYLSVMILSRKLLETTIIRIFEVVYPKYDPSGYNETNHDLWYDKHHGRRHFFGVLIDNLKANSGKFDEDKELIETICSKIKPFKDETNRFVHRDYKIPNESDVKSWKINELMALTHKMYRKYCNP